MTSIVIGLTPSRGQDNLVPVKMFKALAGSCFQKHNSAKIYIYKPLRFTVAKHTIYLTQGSWPHLGFLKKKKEPFRFIY